MFSVFLKIVSIFLIVLSGWALRRKGWFGDGFNRELSLLLINLFYPCLIVSSIVRNFTFAELLANWMLPVGVAGILGTGWLIGRLIAPRLTRTPEPTRRCFHLLCMMNNYSFLPIMLVAALWGEKAVARVSFAALGAELCVWTLGVKAISGQKFSWAFLKNLRSMPMLALAAALAILAGQAGLTRIGMPAPAADTPLHQILQMLLHTAHITGQATIPVSAVICGSRLATLASDHLFSPLMAGLCAIRLLLVPAICIAVIRLLPLPPEIAATLIVVAIQPCAMASVSLAEVYGSDAHFTSAAILVSHLLCLLTLPLWLHLML